jgi:hypothetical protein
MPQRHPSCPDLRQFATLGKLRQAPQQAALAQLVEQLPRKEQVWGSIPQGGS